MKVVTKIGKEDVHKWCIEYGRTYREISNKNIEINFRAAELVVCSAVQCLLELDGSLKFVRLNSFLESLLPQEFATKNDGRQIFFDIRDLVYAKIHDDIKN